MLSTLRVRVFADKLTVLNKFTFSVNLGTSWKLNLSIDFRKKIAAISIRTSKLQLFLSAIVIYILSNSENISFHMFECSAAIDGVAVAQLTFCTPITAISKSVKYTGTSRTNDYSGMFNCGFETTAGAIC